MKKKKKYGEYIKLARERKKRCIPGFFPTSTAIQKCIFLKGKRPVECMAIRQPVHPAAASS